MKGGCHGLLLLLLSCGQASQGVPGDHSGGRATADDFVESGGSFGGSWDPAQGGEQAMATLPQPPGVAGRPNSSEAGGGGSAAEVELRAGTRFCRDFRECFGFDCVDYGGADARICSLECESNRGCELGEICFGTGELGPLCVQPCQGPEDCAFAFDCVALRDVATVCLPSEWTEALMH